MKYPMKHRRIHTLALAALWSGCDAARLPPPPARTDPAPAPVVAAPVVAAPVVAAPAAAAPTPVATPEAPPPTVAAGVRYTVLVTGGAGAHDRLPMVIAVHGLGDTPEAFVELFQRLPVRARVIAVRGLDPFYEGFSWFSPGDADQHPASFQRAVDALAAALPELARQHPSCGLAVATGFSQGAMLSYALAARNPSVVRSAVPISGRLPRHFWPEARPIGGLLPEVFALHGTADDRIPVQSARDTVAAMRGVGFSATLREYPGVRHQITPAMQNDLYEALARMVGGGC